MILEIVAQRQFNTLYIILDCIFLAFLLGLLIYKKNYMTVVVGLIFGVVYMAVDYGIFHLLTHSRSIEGGSMFWTLFWMSMSYGFTNFVWIWLWLKKDKNLLLYSFLILIWWFCCPLLANTFGQGFNVITIQRTTGAYHGYMALMLLIGYAGVVIWNISHEGLHQIPLLWILAIGILVQFGWECGLLIGGIRSALIDSWPQKIETMVINSLLETNLGMPYIYVLYILYRTRFNEDLTKRTKKLSFLEAMEENNRLKVREDMVSQL